MTELRRKVIALLATGLDREVMADVLLDMFVASLPKGKGGRPRIYSLNNGSEDQQPVIEQLSIGISGGEGGASDLTLTSGPASGPSQPIREKGERDAALPTGFIESFWSKYPGHRRVARARAVRAWQRQKPPADRVAAALAWQTRSADWTKDGGKYVPYPEKWINGRQWEDEQPAAPTGPRPPAAHPGLCPYHLVALNANKPAFRHDDKCSECRHVAALKNPRPTSAPTPTGGLI